VATVAVHIVLLLQVVAAVVPFGAQGGVIGVSWGAKLADTSEQHAAGAVAAGAVSFDAWKRGGPKALRILRSGFAGGFC